jgi:hypothetical protein
MIGVVVSVLGLLALVKPPKPAPATAATASAPAATPAPATPTVTPTTTPAALPANTDPLLAIAAANNIGNVLTSEVNTLAAKVPVPTALQAVYSTEISKFTGWLSDTLLKGSKTT